ncbi:hypothetical protein GCM10011348_25110 [Marinobacterium nitratireducens]|uniref:Uncharacterized protein n=1 Tax=Marinobacterium nitratireducens TaxID=518897 RepID=A0A917ZIM9_9GAMM|nr:hypothetical protein GCM10011348_25110 [Marinobacterium nitratireducens]
MDQVTQVADPTRNVSGWYVATRNQSICNAIDMMGPRCPGGETKGEARAIASLDPSYSPIRRVEVLA